MQEGGVTARREYKMRQEKVQEATPTLNTKSAGGRIRGKWREKRVSQRKE